MLKKVFGICFWQVISLSTGTSVAAAEPATKSRGRVVNYAPEASRFEVEVVQRLDNHEARLGHLEKVSGTPVAHSKPAPAPPSTAVPSHEGASTAEAKKAGPTTHTVKEGDTPFNIARRYGLSVAALRKANHLAAAATIHPGQKLRLPGAESPSAAPETRYGYTAQAGKPTARYTVKSGDTVSSLARRSGVSEQELMRLNALKSPAKLKTGTVLRLPSKAGPDSIAPNDATDQVVETPKLLPDGWRWHHVKQGESLSQIAADRNTDRRAIERANDLVGGSAALREGMMLKIPPAEVASTQRTAPAEKVQTRRWSADEDESVLGYTVQKGDSVDSVAEEFQTSPSILRRLNRLGTTETLVAGRRIVVPNTIFE